MIDYVNGKIYKLVNSVDDKVYIGFTCLSLSVRKTALVSEARVAGSSSCVYVHLNQVGWDNVQIVLIEAYKCDNVFQLLRRKNFWIEELKPTLNTRLRKEYYGHDKLKFDVCNKEYYEDNDLMIAVCKREKLKVKKNKKTECDCGGRYTCVNKNTHMKSAKHQNWASVQVPCWYSGS